MPTFLGLYKLFLYLFKNLTNDFVKKFTAEDIISEIVSTVLFKALDLK